jgi:hypothetical protein
MLPRPHRSPSHGSYVAFTEGRGGSSLRDDSAALAERIRSRDRVYAAFKGMSFGSEEYQRLGKSADCFLRAHPEFFSPPGSSKADRQFWAANQGRVRALEAFKSTPARP